MELRWYFWLFVCKAYDTTAVISDRGGETSQTRRRRIGDDSPKAEANDADRSKRLRRVDRRLSIAKKCRPIRIANELLERSLDFIGRIAALEIRLDAVEDRWRERDI